MLEATSYHTRGQLQDIVRCQYILDDATSPLLVDTTNPALQTTKAAAELAKKQASVHLDAIDIEVLYLLTTFKATDTAITRQSNRYYTEFGTTYTVENLAWLSERILFHLQRRTAGQSEGTVGGCFANGKWRATHAETNPRYCYKR